MVPEWMLMARIKLSCTWPLVVGSYKLNSVQGEITSDTTYASSTMHTLPNWNLNMGHSTITVQSLSSGIKGAIFMIYIEIFNFFFFYNIKSVSQKHLWVTTGINSSQATWKKKFFKMLVPRARFFTSTQYYVNNTQNGT